MYLSNWFQMKYEHFGGSYEGVDMFAEVVMINRNVKIYGEMEDNCYDKTLQR